MATKINIKTKIESEMPLWFANLTRVPLVLFNRFTSFPYDHQILGNSKTKIMSDRLNSVLNSLTSHNQIVVDVEKIDVVISNHVEMDHSGCLKDIHKLAPKAQILTSVNGEKGQRLTKKIIKQ